jgi:hypothetical protein
MNKAKKRILMLASILFVWMTVALATAIFFKKDEPLDELEEEVAVEALEAVA